MIPKSLIFSLPLTIYFFLVQPHKNAQRYLIFSTNMKRYSVIYIDKSKTTFSKGFYLCRRGVHRVLGYEAC